MYALPSGTPLRLQAEQTKKLGIHTNKQFQMACHILAQYVTRQTTCYKSLFVGSKEIFPKQCL